MERLLLQQEDAMYAVERALHNFKKLGKAKHTYNVVRNRLANLKDNFIRCHQIHNKLLATATVEQQSEHPYFTGHRFDECTETYDISADYMMAILLSLEQHSSIVHDTPLCIPSFNASHTINTNTVTSQLSAIERTNGDEISIEEMTIKIEPLSSEGNVTMLPGFVPLENTIGTTEILNGIKNYESGSKNRVENIPETLRLKRTIQTLRQKVLRQQKRIISMQNQLCMFRKNSFMFNNTMSLMKNEFESN